MTGRGRLVTGTVVTTSGLSVIPFTDEEMCSERACDSQPVAGGAGSKASLPPDCVLCPATPRPTASPAAAAMLGRPPRQALGWGRRECGTRRAGPGSSLRSAGSGSDVGQDQAPGGSVQHGVWLAALIRSAQARASAVGKTYTWHKTPGRPWS